MSHVVLLHKSPDILDVSYSHRSPHGPGSLSPSLAQWILQIPSMIFCPCTWGQKPELIVPLPSTVEQCQLKNVPKATSKAAVRKAVGPGLILRLLWGSQICGLLCTSLQVLTDSPGQAQWVTQLILIHGG